MRTAPTLCASGAGLGLACIGLAVVREDRSRDPSPSAPEMTAVASYPPSNLTSPPFAFSPPSARATSERQNGKARSSSAKVGEKRLLTPRASFSMGGAERALMGRDGETGGAQQATATPTARPRSWLRRMSSSMSTSRDSSQTPVSRPGSAAVSYSNGSVAFSHAGSTTPMFPDTTPSPLPPNKLVKRTSSLRSVNGSPFSSSGSRLPIPVFRRPATSHQRSATMQERHSGADQSDHMSIDEKSLPARDPQLKHYFTPRVASDDVIYARRRSSTGIPNPIKRIYPDRKYRPMLVSGNEAVKQAPLEFDDGIGFEDEETAVTKISDAPSVASSPLPAQSAPFEEAQVPKRAFSIGDLLSTGPQPLWPRSSQSKGRTSSSSKLLRRGRQRVVSAPQAAMGGGLSRVTGTKTETDGERPSKRRDLTDPLAGQRSIYSSSSSNQHTEPEISHDTQMNLGISTSQPQHVGTSNSPTVESSPFTQTPPPRQQSRLPSATSLTGVKRPARVSVAQSEVPSTVGSDTEYRSDASTGYQSDTVYDSYPTRTTRSSSGRRGPHIETIFDDSPPNFSSGRSTRLKDLLNDGTFAGSEQRYRHSTIEEEESIASTPIRSMHDKSVTSTPSARAGAQQLFTSSPPAIPTMPDPDEIDWDAPFDEPASSGRATQQPPAALTSHPTPKSLPFRFGPALGSALPVSAEPTPTRHQSGNGDRANLFDWSEVQPSPSHTNSPPRPRTVHGKKDPESRGSRPAGRRAPSGMHARSHSVPVVPDVDGKRPNVMANKFGTWGVGSKAVTEDWNEDFDFDESSLPQVSDQESWERRVDSGHEMFVPRSIRERQENVVANIGLLREWGLLIEELKELRIRAVALNMLSGPYAPAWQEVDAMIELADQETAEHTLEPRKSPPSSPGFDYTAFEDTGSASRSRENSNKLPEFAQGDISLPARLSPQPSTPTQSSGFGTRPRKDSEAVARSVIEALQRRSVSDPTTLGRPAAPAKKVPFDTATLRHIVPYVSGLKRKVKDALRETEGLYTSPRRRTSPPVNGRMDSEEEDNDDDEPAFRSIFNEPQDPYAAIAAAARRRSRREQAATDHDGFDDEDEGDDNEPPDHRAELARRVQDMKLPR